MMASELESDVAPQDTAAASSDNPPPVTLPEDQPILYRVSTDTEYTSRYIQDADQRLKKLTGGIPEAEQYFALKVRGGYQKILVVIEEHIADMLSEFIFGAPLDVPA